MNRIVVLMLLLGFLPQSTLAEDQQLVAEEELINCAHYRAKRDGVPVYEEGDTSSRVVAKLKLGENVCHIGERGDFAIVDWRKQDLINKREKDKNAAKGPERVFIKLTDLWGDPRPARRNPGEPRDIYDQAKDQLDTMRHGLPPEDVYGPFRPIIDFLHSPIKCRAGKEICEKVEAEQREYEEQQKNQQPKQ